jgi:Kef-type K+ transport system membrane component KefB
MGWADALRDQLPALPSLAKFAIVMAVIVGVPALARRAGTPGLVALLIFGVLLGPHVLGLAQENHPIIQFFADLGRLMLMFTAGLEIDLERFRQAQTRSVTFGFITTVVPQALGTAYGLAFCYPIIPGVVIGSLLASHTLISLPIVARLGALALPPAVVTMGATMVSDTLSLIVFGVCVSTYTTGLSPSGLALQIVEVAVFVPLILVGVSRAGSWILNRLRDNEEACFVAMLGIMALAGVLADLINLPDIVGAFLAGRAVNAAAERQPAKEKLTFIGKALFTPIFFLVTGFLISPVAVARTMLDDFWLVAGIVAALIAGKGIAAEIAGRAFGYGRRTRLTMAAMTLPQVAATLAATLVGYNTLNSAGVRLLDEKMFNAVLVLMVVTSILGPVLTERFAPGMIEEDKQRRLGYGHT